MLKTTTTTVRKLRYSIPLKGALDHTDMNQKMKIVVIRSLSDILSGKLILKVLNIICSIFHAQHTAPSSASSTEPEGDPNIGKRAQDALNAHSEDLKELLSDMSILGDVAGACKQAKIITSGQYRGIFDETNQKRVSERVDQLLNCVMSVVKYSPKQLEVFLNILIDKGNVAFVVVAKRIAQSCKLSTII